MENQTVFIKRYPNKGELPKESGSFIVKSIKGVVRTSTYKSILGYFIKGVIGGDIRKDEIEWFLEEIELPSEEEVKSRSRVVANGNAILRKFFTRGANFILNNLKSNTNEIL